MFAREGLEELDWRRPEEGRYLGLASTRIWSTMPPSWSPPPCWPGGGGPALLVSTLTLWWHSLPNWSPHYPFVDPLPPPPFWPQPYPLFNPSPPPSWSPLYLLVLSLIFTVFFHTLCLCIYLPLSWLMSEIPGGGGGGVKLTPSISEV